MFVPAMSPSCPESHVQKHRATTIPKVTPINVRLGEVRLAPTEALRIAGAKDCFVPDSRKPSAGCHRQQPLHCRRTCKSSLQEPQRASDHDHIASRSEALRILPTGDLGS